MPPSQYAFTTSRAPLPSKSLKRCPLKCSRFPITMSTQPSTRIQDTTQLPSENRIDIQHLLSACVAAAHRACDVIRHVQAAREGGASIGESYKDLSDPRSALTVADIRAQTAIVIPLLKQFPALTIVAEEDSDSQILDDLALSAPLDLFPLAIQAPDHFRSVPIDDVCVFCDPVDGTLEFVNQNLEAVQTLIGITLRGEPVAGVIGRPFVGDQVLYGIVGSGVVNIPVSAQLRKERSGLCLASSYSSTNPVITATTSVIRPTEIIRAGGAGNKMLLVASGAVDMCMLNLATSLWDTAATTAIITAAGGVVTDLFGNKIMHYPTSRIKNRYGVLVSGKSLSAHDVDGRTHSVITQELRNSMVLDSLLKDTGLVSDGKPQATDIALDLNGNPITSSWLSACLKLEVSGFTVDESTSVRYLMSLACRVMLHYNSHVENAPKSVFMKRIVMKDLEHVRLKARTAPHKLKRDVESYRIESSFISSKACQKLRAVGTKIARPHYADLRPAPKGYSPIESKFFLLLEDFSAEDGWVQSGLLEYEKMTATLRALASMHAFFWDSKADPNFDELNSCVWDQATYWVPKRQAADSFSKLATCWEMIKTNFAEELKTFGLDPEVDETIDSFGTVLATHARDIAEEVHSVGLNSDHPHRTIIHGDAKAANFFFRHLPRDAANSSGQECQGNNVLEVGIIDFQWCGWGHPAVDVAYLIAASASPDILNFDGSAEKKLLAAYHEELAKCLVSYSKAPDIKTAREVLSMSDLISAYENALLDLSRLVVSYHWDRIGANAKVLKSRENNLGSNSYNKNVNCAMWLIARAVALVTQRDSFS